MATKKTAVTDKQAVGFEQALQRLEAIVREMEGGSLSLDTMIQRFEEGQALIGVCNKKLNEVERKIDVEWARATAEMLVKKDGETKAVPFEDEAEDSDGDDGKNGEEEKKDDDGTVPF